MRSRHSILLLATILALLWQNVLAAAHQHWAASSPISAASTTLQVGHDTGLPSPDHPADCPICQELVHTGQYLPVVPFAFDPPDADEIWLPVIAILGSSACRRSHAWQSRAPPTPLQA